MSDSTSMLRLLRREDVEAAFALSAQAGWNQTKDDWRMLLELAPESCWGIEIDGVLAATTTLLCYGRCLAWVGMVLTKKEFQRRGLAKRLFANALEWVDANGIGTVKLDATEQGRPLYEKFGFRSERKIERWGRAGDAGAAVTFSAGQALSSDRWTGLDRASFGTDRLELLRRLAQRNSPLVESRSTLFARAGRVNGYLGPCVAESSAIAGELIRRCVENTRCGWVWDLFPDNREAVLLAKKLEFAPQRHLTRMACGGELRDDVNAIYAIAGFELG